MAYGEIDSTLVQLIRTCVEKKQLPPVLYRYRAFDDFTDQCISEGKQWFSAPFAFNDPFDCQIRDNGEYTAEELKAYFIRAGAGEYWTDVIVNRDMTDNKEMIRAALERAKTNVFKGAGILCLSARNDSILMWSHYAASHSGYLLGFSLLDDPLFFIAPHRVKYDPTYPSFSYIRNPKDILPKGMGTKAKEWEYEQEVRIIKPGSGLHPYQKKCLSEVILGCRVTTANKERMVNFLRDPTYNHVTLRQAQVSETAFVLNFNPVT